MLRSVGICFVSLKRAWQAFPSFIRARVFSASVQTGEQIPYVVNQTDKHTDKYGREPTPC